MDGSGQTSLGVKEIDAASLPALLIAREEQTRRFVQSRIPAKFRSVVSADDVVQEAWISAFRSIATFDPVGPRAFDRWLMSITQKKMIDAIKSAGRLKRGGNVRMLRGARYHGSSLTDLFERIASPQQTPSRDCSTREAALSIRLALSQLSDQRREVVEMRYFLGLSRREIATKLSKSEAAVNSLIFHGIREMRRHLGEAAKYFSNVASSDDVG